MPESPSYYVNAARGGSIIDFAERLNFHRGRALALIFRAGRKPGRTAIDDLEAARDHLDAEISRIRTDGMEVPKDPIEPIDIPDGPGWREIAKPRLKLAKWCVKCLHKGHWGICGEKVDEGGIGLSRDQCGCNSATVESISENVSWSEIY